MTRRVFLVWLNWPEKCFRCGAEALRALRTLVPAGSEVRRVTGERAFLRELPEATHVLTWHFRREWFARGGRLRLVATPAAGREFVATEGPKGVTVHFGGFHGAIISESVAGYMLARSRGFLLPEIAGRPTAGTGPWPRVTISGKCRLLAGTRAVIAGYGRIGRAIGAKIAALGVLVTGITRRNLDALPGAAAEADWFILALPGDTGTDGFLSSALIRRLPRRCVVINVGRGNAVDEAALARALKSGRLAGAYLDVLRHEPPETDGVEGELLKLATVMPHASAFAPEYLPLFFRELDEEGLLEL